jgi:hypothetical protein
MSLVMRNVIKRNAISIKGISTIKTNATEIGDTIHATKTDGRWTMLNYNTGKYYHCFSDFLRQHITITEQITAQ